MERRILALERNQIGTSMTAAGDTNVYRAVQRALITSNLTLGGGINDLPQESSILSMNARNKGFLMPRTNDITLVTNPIEGMMLYNYDFEAVMVYNGNAWGLTPPRMTNTQMLAIANPLSGMVVYNTTHDGIEFYNGSAWGMFMPSLTTTQRDALTPAEGQVIFNDTTNKLNFYTGSAWEAVTSA